MASVGIISNYSELPKTIIKIDSGVHHENFKNEWREIVKRFNNAKDDALLSDNIEAAKLISDLVYELAELIHFNSSLVSVRISTFGTSKRLYDHFMIHLSKEIFAKETISFMGNDINNSFKLAKLIYIDDSIIRFLPELVAKPKDIHEKAINIIGSPKEILDWVINVEKLYYRFLKRKIRKEDLLNGIESLYDKKNDIIKTAIEMKIFLPISPKTIISEDKEYLLDKINKNWIRSKKVDPDIVLNYLYLNEIQNLKEIGLILDD